jgi:hypothetical protein
MLVTIDLEYSIEMLIIYYVAKCLSVIIHYSFIYIYIVTLTLYEETWLHSPLPHAVMPIAHYP